ncbi:MAG: sodium/solute symporter [Alphaproteobacteria bacterium]
MATFGTLNWTIVGGYLLASLALGFAVSAKVTTAEDFFLGRRATPWWAIGLSVLATYVSALTFLGAPAWSYGTGMSVIAIHLNYPLVIILVITVFLPFFFRSGVASIYEYQERRFGPTSRAVLAGIFLLSQTLNSAAVLYATALVIEFITGIDVAAAIVIMACVALVYTALGGITAVIWTDVIQASILLAGGAYIIWMLIANLPQSLGETVLDLRAAGKMNALDFSFDPASATTIWAGIIAMSLYHTTVYGASQMMVQRTLAAASLADAKKAFLAMGYGAFFVYLLFIFLGVLFFAYYDGRAFANGNTIILDFAQTYAVPGLMGVLAAAIVAASMSSLDSALNSLATISVVDFYQKYLEPERSPEHYLAVSRMFTVVWAVLIIVPALIYARSEGSVLEILSKVGSYFVGAKLSMYALGFFSNTTTERGLLVGVAAGFVAVWFTATQTDIAWPWFAVIGAGVNAAVSIPASLMIDGRPAGLHPYTVAGQKQVMAQAGEPETVEGWSVVPGRFDRASLWLFAFFILTLVITAFFDTIILWTGF